MRNMNSSFALFILFVWFHKACCLSPQSNYKESDRLKFNDGAYGNPQAMDNHDIFSPRMDYDEWTPLGRGDPLKNDPTYDYVPPVLERVHYWMDPSKRTPDPPVPHSGLLVLGSRTEPSFTTRPPPSTSRYEAQQQSKEAESRLDTSSLLDPFFKLMDMSQFGINFNANNNYKPISNRIQWQHHQNKHKTQPPQALQRPPYTMLMPPPPPPSMVTNYVSSQSLLMTLPNSNQTQLTTAPPPTMPSAPVTEKNTTTVNPTALANTENVFRPVAISMPGHVAELENETRTDTRLNVDSTKPTIEHSTILPTFTLSSQKFNKAEVTLKQKNSNSTGGSRLKFSPKPSLSQSKNEDNTLKLIRESGTPPKSLVTKEIQITKNSIPHDTGTTTSHRTTTASPITSTKIDVLTTDTMPKHYKEPLEPVRGPFYLIIQGHSKVKTYGANKNPINRLLTSNEIKQDNNGEEKHRNKILGKKGRRLRQNTRESSKSKDQNDLEEPEHNRIVRRLRISDTENPNDLEETFGGKSKGGSTKKRNLNTEGRWQRPPYEGDNVRHGRLLTENEPLQENPESLNFENLLSVNYDYDSRDVDALLRQAGNQGSGFGEPL